MIETISNAPANVAAFRATGEVTKDDYTATVMPRVEKVVEQNGELNFLLLLDTDVKNFTMGAWMQDLLVGVKNLTKWHKAAIVSDSEGVIKFTDTFGVAAPGEFKGFKKNELDAALAWVAAD